MHLMIYCIYVSHSNIEILYVCITQQHTNAYNGYKCTEFGPDSLFCIRNENVYYCLLDTHTLNLIDNIIDYFMHG
jgi:hypothetical protein